MKQIIKQSEDSIEYYNEKNQLHREDGPALEYSNGNKYWFKNGLKHREDGPAVMLYERCEWYLNGKMHREDGPAIEYYNGDVNWVFDNKVHRLDGPAVVWNKGKNKLFYINGNKINEEDYWKHPDVIAYRLKKDFEFLEA